MVMTANNSAVCLFPRFKLYDMSTYVDIQYDGNICTKLQVTEGVCPIPIGMIKNMSKNIENVSSTVNPVGPTANIVLNIRGWNGHVELWCSSLFAHTDGEVLNEAGESQLTALFDENFSAGFLSDISVFLEVTYIRQ